MDDKRIKALGKILKVYAETDEFVSQKFYQGLCILAYEALREQAIKLKQKVSLNNSVNNSIKEKERNT